MTPRPVMRSPGAGVRYRRIAEILETEIRREMNAGDRLPPEQKMAERFGVNRHTLRRAVEVLMASGLVERRWGKGVFVLHPPVSYGMQADSRFTETLTAAGCKTETRVIRRHFIPANKEIAGMLEVKEGEEICWLETLRYVDGIPFLVSSHYLPPPFSIRAYEAYTGGSFHAFLQEHFAIAIRMTESRITARLPAASDAEILGIPVHQPLLAAKSLYRTQKGETLEWTRTRFRADRVSLSVCPAEMQIASCRNCRKEGCQQNLSEKETPWKPS